MPAFSLAYATAPTRSAAKRSTTPGWVFGRVMQKCSADGRCRPFIRQRREARKSLTRKMSSPLSSVVLKATLKNGSPSTRSSGTASTARRTAAAVAKMSAAIAR